MVVVGVSQWLVYEGACFFLVNDGFLMVISYETLRSMMVLKVDQWRFANGASTALFHHRVSLYDLW